MVEYKILSQKTQFIKQLVFNSSQMRGSKHPLIVNVHFKQSANRKCIHQDNDAPQLVLLLSILSCINNRVQLRYRCQVIDILDFISTYKLIRQRNVYQSYHIRWCGNPRCSIYPFSPFDVYCMRQPCILHLSCNPTTQRWSGTQRMTQCTAINIRIRT